MRAPKPLTSSKAEELLRHCVEFGNMVLTQHFRDELKNERLEMLDIMPVLNTGTISQPAEQDIKTGEWKYRVEGYEIGGKWLCVIFRLEGQDTAILITVFSVQSRQRK
jgi:hypothetical protein